MLPRDENGLGIETPRTFSGAERIRRDHRDDRGIDSAAQTEDGAFESAFRQIIAHA